MQQRFYLRCIGEEGKSGEEWPEPTGKFRCCLASMDEFLPICAASFKLEKCIGAMEPNLSCRSAGESLPIFWSQGYNITTEGTVVPEGAAPFGLITGTGYIPYGTLLEACTNDLEELICPFCRWFERIE